MTTVLIIVAVWIAVTVGVSIYELRGGKEPRRRTPPSMSTSIPELLAGLTARIPTESEIDNILDPAFKDFMRTGEVDVRWVRALDESDARHGRVATVRR